MCGVTARWVGEVCWYVWGRVEGVEKVERAEGVDAAPPFTLHAPRQVTFSTLLYVPYGPMTAPWLLLMLTMVWSACRNMAFSSKLSLPTRSDTRSSQPSVGSRYGRTAALTAELVPERSATSKRVRIGIVAVNQLSWCGRCAWTRACARDEENTIDLSNLIS